MVSSLLFREKTPRDLAFLELLSSFVVSWGIVAPKISRYSSWLVTLRKDEGRYRWMVDVVRRLDYFQYIFSDALFAEIAFLLSLRRKGEREGRVRFRLFSLRIYFSSHLRDSFIVTRDSIVISWLISFIWNHRYYHYENFIIIKHLRNEFLL